MDSGKTIQKKKRLRFASERDKELKEQGRRIFDFDILQLSGVLRDINTNLSNRHISGFGFIWRIRSSTEEEETREN